MSNFYNRLKEQSDGIDNYVSAARLSIHTQNRDIEVQAEQTVNIPFSIDMDASDYGIKNIEILATSTITVEWAETNINDQNDQNNIQRSAKVDLSTAEVEWVPGGFYGISELILSVTTDGGVANAKLVFVYIEKGT